jgi:hypothetical protein
MAVLPLLHLEAQTSVGLIHIKKIGIKHIDVYVGVLFPKQNFMAIYIAKKFCCQIVYS